MYNVTARQLRIRCDRVLTQINDARISTVEKLVELWALVSDMQLWIEDHEMKERLHDESTGEIHTAR